MASEIRWLNQPNRPARLVRRVNQCSPSSSARWRKEVPRAAETPAPRKSRREQLAEVAEQPFVRRAMELFDVGPGQFRYMPPEGDST